MASATGQAKALAAEAAAALTPIVANESGPAPIVLVPPDPPDSPPALAPVSVPPRSAPARSPVKRIVALLLLAIVAYFTLRNLR